jgi:hypothetical protein
LSRGREKERERENEVAKVEGKNDDERKDENAKANILWHKRAGEGTTTMRTIERRYTI